MKFKIIALTVYQTQNIEGKKVSICLQFLLTHLCFITIDFNEFDSLKLPIPNDPVNDEYIVLPYLVSACCARGLSLRIRVRAAAASSSVKGTRHTRR